MPAVDISPKLDGGVMKEILKEGIGDEKPTPGCKVSVHYIGTLLDGTKFDSSRDRGEPFEFELGKKDVIKAWDISVATMKKGEVALVTCTSDYAYKAKGSEPNIPPHATLKFEIEMLDWKGTDLSPDGDGSIEKYQIDAGTGFLMPNDGAVVDVNLVGKYNGKVFDERDVKFIVGEGEEIDIIEGVETALTHFKMGEKSKVKIKSRHAFGKTGSTKFNIPPNADVEYIIHMKNFEKAASTWTMSADELLKEVALIKEKGNKFFKKGKYKMALKAYNRIEPAFEKCRAEFEGENETNKHAAKLSAHLNLALCYLKINDYLEAKNACDAALKINENNEKALFRRGQANLGLAAPDMALSDFERVLELNPNNTAAASQIVLSKKMHKEQLGKERKIYANMFDKFAFRDKQKEEEILRGQPDVMRGVLGEWGQEERPGGRDPTAFEKENPNILMLNANGTGEFKNM